MDDAFFQSLDKNTVVLTANRRLANYLYHRYADAQRQQNNLVWETPSILPMNAWLHQIWLSLGNSQKVLSSFQEKTLWKSISQQNWPSLSTLQQAWNHLIAWEIPLQTLQKNNNGNVIAFYEWACVFSARCQKNHWITSAELPQQLITAKHLPEHIPSKIYLTGFDDLPPLISQLLKKLAPDCMITTLEPTKQANEIKRYALDNTESELEHMAAWAHQQLLNFPDKKIGCVVPNLADNRHQVLRIFNRQFEDSSIFNISAGQNLNTFLLIQTALQVIRLLGGSLNDNEWESLLQSPYLMITDDDYDVGAITDKMRRQYNLSHIGMEALLPIFSMLQTRFPNASYLRRWNHAHQLKKSIPERQKPSQWANTFIECLQIFQWPGSRVLNSLEHQLLQRWLKALEEFSECDTTVSDINLDTVFSLFNNHINDIIFQAKSTDAPIQILGVLETTGIDFDAIWIMGMDNENWPPAASPNPFIPFKLQVAHNMPHASAERELTFTQHTLDRLLNSAKEVNLSSSKNDGDRVLKPSSLLERYKQSSLVEGSDRFFVHKLTKKDAFTIPEDFSASCIEDITDKQAPVVTQNEEICGGTFILKHQSLCPFSAFANIRLKTEALDTPTIGLSAKLRGQILHQTLQTIWQELKNQENLLQKDSDALNTFITKTIEATISKLIINRTDLIFSETEKLRLIEIVNEWLSLEKQRTPFTVVEQEAEHLITIGKLSFQCRIDRVDQLPSGKQLVIDYKSGYSSIHNWFSDRPSEPQLPIYCSFANAQSFDGLLFAQIRAGALQFKGITSENIPDINLPGIVKIDEFDNIDEITNWYELTDHWDQTLTHLSNEFIQGNAAVDPLENACLYCELQPLCRVNE